MNGNSKIFTALVGMVALFAPLTGKADDPPPEPVEVALAIDSFELGPDVGPRFEQRLYDPMSGILKSHAFEVRGPDGAPPTVRTSLAYLDDSHSNYAVHIDLIDEQGTVTPLIEGFACMACTERRLIEQTLESFRHATAGLHNVLSGNPPDLVPVAPQLVDPPPIKKIGPLGYTGIGVSSGGLLMALVGTGLIASEHPSADAALGVGITALGLGIAAILGDVVSRRRASDRPRKVRIEPAPPQSGIAFSFGL